MWKSLPKKYIWAGKIVMSQFRARRMCVKLQTHCYFYDATHFPSNVEFVLLNRKYLVENWNTQEFMRNKKAHIVESWWKQKKFN